MLTLLHLSIVAEVSLVWHGKTLTTPIGADKGRPLEKE